MKKFISLLTLGAVAVFCTLPFGMISNAQTENTKPVPTETTTERKIIYESIGCIVIDSLPKKTEYTVGERLDLSDLKVSFIWAYGKDGRDIVFDKVDPNEYPDDFIIDTSEFNSSKTGEYSIAIRPTKKLKEKYSYRVSDNTNFTVKVSEPVDEVSYDINKDGAFGLADINYLKKWMVNYSENSLKEPKASDVNNDGKINAVDLTLLKQKFISKIDKEPQLSICITRYGWPYLNKSTVKYEDISDKKLEKVPQIRELTKKIAEKADDFEKYEDGDTKKDIYAYSITDTGYDKLYILYKNSDGNYKKINLCSFGDVVLCVNDDDVHQLVEILHDNGYYGISNEWTKCETN